MNTRIIIIAAAGLVVGIAAAEYMLRGGKANPGAQVTRAPSPRIKSRMMERSISGTFVSGDANVRSFERPEEERFSRGPDGAELVQRVDAVTEREEARRRWEEHGPTQDRDVKRSLKRQAKQLKVFRAMAGQENPDDTHNLLDLEGIAELEATGKVVH